MRHIPPCLLSGAITFELYALHISFEATHLHGGLSSLAALGSYDRPCSTYRSHAAGLSQAARTSAFCQSSSEFHVATADFSEYAAWAASRLTSASSA